MRSLARPAGDAAAVDGARTWFLRWGSDAVASRGPVLWSRLHPGRTRVTVVFIEFSRLAAPVSSVTGMARVAPPAGGAWRRRSSRCRCWWPSSSSAPASARRTSRPSAAASSRRRRRVLAVAHTMAAPPQRGRRGRPARTPRRRSSRRRAGAARDRHRLRRRHEPRRGIRYTHPDPSQIGKQFIGHIAAGASRAATSTRATRARWARRCGPSCRSSEAGRVVALVSVGIRERRSARRCGAQLPGRSAWPVRWPPRCRASAPGWSPAASAGRPTGSAPRSCRTMYDYYDAVLHAVREGLLLVDGDGPASGWSTTRPRGCSACPPTSSAGRWPSSG